MFWQEEVEIYVIKLNIICFSYRNSQIPIKTLILHNKPAILPGFSLKITSELWYINSIKSIIYGSAVDKILNIPAMWHWSYQASKKS